jgi:hypothetical protein
MYGPKISMISGGVLVSGCMQVSKHLAVTLTGCGCGGLIKIPSWLQVIILLRAEKLEVRCLLCNM